MKRSYSIIVLLLLFIAACKKEEKKPVGNYTFTSEISGPVNVDIYASLDDYNNNTNLAYHGIVPASGKLDVPMNTFKENTEYFVDWYTDNYKFTNWWYLGKGIIEMGVPANGDEFMIKGGDMENLRVFMQNGKESRVRWVAVGIHSDPAKWNSLSQEEKKHEVTFSKDGMATYKSANEDFAGKIKHVSGDDHNIAIILGNPQASNHFWVMGNGKPDSTGIGFPPVYSTDTMVLVSADNSIPPLLMLRQK